jgi:hypothetical protein
LLTRLAKVEIMNRQMAFFFAAALAAVSPLVAALPDGYSQVEYIETK